MTNEKLKQLKNLASQGDVDAQFQLGEYYWRMFFESDTEDEEEKAQKQCIKWYKKAALQNHVESQLILGEIYEQGVMGDEDCDEADKWYRLAAVQGNVTGQYRLADLCYDEEEYEKAVKWYEKSAEQGDDDAREALEKLGVSSDTSR
jgi:TPR repeat protein